MNEARGQSMAKLIMSLDGSIIREIPLDKERVTIGRKPTNDVQIENLAVSGEHARVVTILNDSFLEDLGSTNGTLVNGAPVKKHILQSNDLIEIGKYKLKFIAEGPAPQAAAPAAEDMEKTMVLRHGASMARPAIPPAAPAAAAAQPAAAAAQTVAAIQVISGPGAGKELEITKNLTTLGKPGVQVAVITKRPQGYFIAHVEGAKFPIVNGATLEAQARQLNDHDVIEIAGVKMEFFYKTR
jgi:predicted component of type VI protein secretion system